jgi:asparagine synthase (glutamine-hydrolysing)
VSGIVGIVNLDGAPVDRDLLSAMTRYMDFRGPDGEKTWCERSTGFGHTLLRIGPEATCEEQPASLDGKYWIVADARIDGRAELIEKLRFKGGAVSLADADHQLILYAYQVWGPACVEHLLGDFAFAIWDAETRRLFCARDHFGLKPFFYARVRNSFLFSNTLDCLRMHPEVSDKLNDAAVGDFLLFDFNQDLGTTTFRDILRLPPAHVLECDAEKLSVRRYWTLPESEPAYFKRSQECLDQFRELLDAAVDDRMRSNTACIALSGGLDSPTVAASARRILDRRAAPVDLWSYTLVYKTLVPHEEGRLSGLVAKALRIDAKQLIADHGKLFGDFDEPDYRTPEPLHSPMGFSGVNPLPSIAVRGRMLMTGLGADPLLASLRSQYVRRMIKTKQFGRLAKDVAGYFSAEGRFSRLYLRGHSHRLFDPGAEIEQYPPWLNPEFEKRLNLRERWNQVCPAPKAGHSVRPEAHSAMMLPQWAGSFEVGDPGTTRFPVEWRQPFLDLRLVKFLLALPALPWCVDKQILREAGRGVLPDAVRLRRKSPLSADPIIEALRRPETAWVDHIDPEPRLDPYVVQNKVPRLCGTEDTVISWVHLRPLSLSFWLQRLKVSAYNSDSHMAGGKL